MPAHLSDELIDRIVKEIRKEFGKPPVLSWEDTDAYYKIMGGFVTSIWPTDFFEKCLVREMTDATWEALRDVRHKTLSIERKFRQSLEFQKKRQKLLEAKQEYQKKNADERKDLLEKGELTSGYRKFELEWLLDDTVHEADELVEQAADEQDQSRALEGAINYFEKLDELQGKAVDRRNDLLEQLEHYRDVQPEWIGDIVRKEVLEEDQKNWLPSPVPTGGNNR